MNDLISVIIPTYNRQHIILDAIESVENQSYINWEIVVVDDCSTDQTSDILQNRDNINYIKLEKNKGNAGARNVGVKISKGKYIVFLDSDDRMKKNCLEIFNELLQRLPDTLFAFGDHEVYNVQNGLKKISTWKPNPTKSFLEELKIGTGCGIMVHRKCFDIIGMFDERLRVAVDTDWLIRLNKQISFKYIPEVLVTIYLHKGERVRNNKGELIKSYEIILEKNKEEILRNPKLTRRFFYKLQWMNYHHNDIKNGNNYFFKLLNKNVVNSKIILVYLIFNLLPANLAQKLHMKLSGNKSI